MNWKINRGIDKPLYQQLIDEIKQKIKKGELIPGDKLPSERRLSEILGVNRSTVIRAFDELASEGVLDRTKGSGTKISQDSLSPLWGKHMNWQKFIKNEKATPEGAYKKQLLDKLNQEKVIDAYSGELPQAIIPSFSFPEMNWHDFIKVDTADDSFGMLQLREALSSLMKNEFGYKMAVDELLVTSGGQQGLFFIINALLKEGDMIAIESPSYFYSLPIFEMLGIKTLGIPMDSQGINLTYLEKIIKENPVKMIFINPSFQNPTTISMSLERKQQLIALSQKHQVIIIEDDVYGLLKHEKKSPPLLKELAEDNVIYVGSMTKVLGKTIQLGWINAPRKVLEQMILVRAEWEQPLSIFSQVLVYQAITQPSFNERLNELRAELRKNVHFLYNLIQKELGAVFRCELPNGGYYLWLTAKNKQLSIAHWQFLLTENILVFPSFLITENAQSIRINVANLSKSDCIKLVNTLKMMEIK